jgi:hypothetical protein
MRRCSSEEQCVYIDGRGHVTHVFMFQLVCQRRFVDRILHVHSVNPTSLGKTVKAAITEANVSHATHTTYEK